MSIKDLKLGEGGSTPGAESHTQRQAYLADKQGVLRGYNDGTDAPARMKRLE